MQLYPETARAKIDELSRQLAHLDLTITRAVYHDTARQELRAELSDLDRRLAASRFLLGTDLSLADIRLWVLLVRYDASPNANGAAGPKLTTFDNLWAYARDLYSQPAFRDTTDFAAFTASVTQLPDWTQPTDRSRLSSFSAGLTSDLRGRHACATT